MSGAYLERLHENPMRTRGLDFIRLADGITKDALHVPQHLVVLQRDNALWRRYVRKTFGELLRHKFVALLAGVLSRRASFLEAHCDFRGRRCTGVLPQVVDNELYAEARLLWDEEPDLLIKGALLTPVRRSASRAERSVHDLRIGTSLIGARLQNTQLCDASDSASS